MSPGKFSGFYRFLLSAVSAMFLLTACGGGDSGRPATGTERTGTEGSGGSEIVFTGVEGEGPAPEQRIIFREGFESPIIDIHTVNQQTSWLRIQQEFDRVTDELYISVTPVVTDTGMIGERNAATFTAGSTNVGTTTVDYERQNGERGHLEFTYRYTPGHALSAPENLELTINDVNELSSVVEKNFSITSNRRSGSINWRASLPQVLGEPRWLLLNSATGNTDTPDFGMISLNASTTATFYHGLYTSRLIISSDDPYVSSLEIPVTLNIIRPRTNFVAPYVALTGMAESVIIRGGGFSELQDISVSFDHAMAGQFAAENFTIVSDTEIQASYPALAAGNYRVNVSGSNYSPASQAELVVVEPTVFNYAVVGDGFSVANRKSRIFYDAERKAVFVTDRDHPVYLHGFYFVNNAWTHQIHNGLTSYGTGDMDISPDGKFFLGIDSRGREIRRNKPDLAPDWIRGSGILAPEGYQYAVAFSNDGNALIRITIPQTNSTSTTAKIFDPMSVRTLDVDLSQGASLAAIDQMRIRMSADGSRGVLGYWSDSELIPSVEYFDSRTKSIIDTGIDLNVDNLSIDRSGARTIINSSVYNDSFELLGRLPETSVSSVISHDGLWAYTIEMTLPNETIRKFNLSSLDSNGYFVEQSHTVLGDSPGANPLLAITPDRGTLFIVGDHQLIVQPAP